jgi:5-methylcytosine-specific restriction protein A
VPHVKFCNGCDRSFLLSELKAGRCAPCRRAYEKERLQREPRRRICSLKRWQDTREAVKRRDGYACIRCGSSERLEVHHRVKLRFARNPYDLGNLETLCLWCHRKVERGEAALFPSTDWRDPAQSRFLSPDSDEQAKGRLFEPAGLTSAAREPRKKLGEKENSPRNKATWRETRRALREHGRSGDWVLVNPTDEAA